jgi:hypothetical protein
VTGAEGIARWTRDIVAQIVPTQVELALSRADAALFDRAIAGNPELATAVRALDGHLVVPATIGMAGRNVYRLTNHNRSFCIAVAPTDNIHGAPTIVLKGVEPLMGDFAEYVKWMALSPFRQSPRTMAEHFPLAEGKIPGSVAVREVRHEAELALELQRRHLRHYGELARTPLPLFVYKLCDADGAWRSALERHLSSAAFERIQPLLAEGLGALAYLYPSSPVRADHVGVDRKLSEYIKSAWPTDRTIANWIALLARMMLLGYMPLTPLHEGLGGCMDAGNAALDGGFCDLDSLVPIEECADDEFFLASVLICLRELRDTCLRVLSPGMGIIGSRLYPQNDEFVVTQYLVRELACALEREARPGLVADPRFARILEPFELKMVLQLLERKPRPRTFKAFMTRSPGA